MENLEEEIRRFCRQHHLRIDTDLGQHFLMDAEVLQAIVEAAGIAPTDHIVEIGAGIGVLTKELLARAGHVTAIELDPTLIPLLREYLAKSAPTTNNQQRLPAAALAKAGTTSNILTLTQGNALEIPFPKTPYKIVANIPYYITSPLLRHAFLESPRPPTTMTLLLQREVAEKICRAEAKTLSDPADAGRSQGGWKDAGMLTILVGLFGTPRLVRRVPAFAFLPPPAVESAILHVDCFPEPRADRATMEEVFRLTKIAFGQKRKMLRNTLGGLPGGMERLARAGTDPTRRPQTLTMEEWVSLASASRNS